MNIEQAFEIRKKKRIFENFTLNLSESAHT